MNPTIRAAVAAFDALAMAVFAYLQTGGFGNPGIHVMLWGSAAAAVPGLAALGGGGSAVDAGTPAAAVCAVVLPHRTAIGGDVFALVYDSRARAVTAYNGSGAAPAMSDPGAFPQGFEEQGVRLAT